MDSTTELLLTPLSAAREALTWKLSGLDEYAVRRPLTSTGLSLLGVHVHVGVCVAAYFGEVFDRPFGEPLPDVSADPHADFVPSPSRSLPDTMDLVERYWDHGVATIRAVGPDAKGLVPWWRPGQRVTTLVPVLVHMVAEAQRHLGQVDVLRETLDGQIGLREHIDNLPDDVDWTAHVARVERVAREAAERWA